MFNRRKLMQTAAALAAPCVAARAWAREPGAPLPKVGSVLSLPALTLLDGSAWKPSAAGGKTLVVYWWASWCPFCAVQSPHIEALWRAQKARGLEVLACYRSSDKALGNLEIAQRTRLPKSTVSRLTATLVRLATNRGLIAKGLESNYKTQLY